MGNFRDKREKRNGATFYVSAGTTPGMTGKHSKITARVGEQAQNIPNDALVGVFLGVS